MIFYPYCQFIYHITLTLPPRKYLYTTFFRFSIVIVIIAIAMIGQKVMNVCDNESCLSISIFLVDAQPKLELHKTFLYPDIRCTSYVHQTQAVCPLGYLHGQTEWGQMSPCLVNTIPKPIGFSITSNEYISSTLFSGAKNQNENQGFILLRQLSRAGISCHYLDFLGQVLRLLFDLDQVFIWFPIENHSGEYDLSCCICEVKLFLKKYCVFTVLNGSMQHFAFSSFLIPKYSKELIKCEKLHACFDYLLCLCFCLPDAYILRCNIK